MLHGQLPGCQGVDGTGCSSQLVFYPPVRHAPDKHLIHASSEAQNILATKHLHVPSGGRFHTDRLSHGLGAQPLCLESF